MANEMTKYQKIIRMLLLLPALVFSIIALFHIGLVEGIGGFPMLCFFFVGVAAGIIVLSWLESFRD